MKIIDKFLSIFQKKPVTSSRENHRTYYFGGNWGHTIGWSNPDEFSESYNRLTYSVAGNKEPKPVPGDVIFYKNTEGRVSIFIFTKVRYVDDLFYGTIAFCNFADEFGGLYEEVGTAEGN
jgi:hypothetical protein